MKMRFKARLLYEKVAEGLMTNAIIGYAERDYEQRQSLGAPSYFYINKTQHLLMVDLWLVIFRFEWFKDHDDPFKDEYYDEK